MYAGLKKYLCKPENEPFWLDQEPEAFTALEAQFETGAGDLGAFGESQSQTITGNTAQQNLAETSLEDLAHPLSRALRLHLKVAGDLVGAAVWDLSLTDWRRLQEQPLLDKAKALHAAILPLTLGNPPPGQPQGLTTAKAAALLDLIEDYAEEIGSPIAARSGRKAKTSALRPRFRVVDGYLEDMDDLVLQFRGTPPGDLFVDGYFNARRIGGRGPGADTTPPETPPANP